MSYQHQTSIAFKRRTFLKTAGFASLCSLVAPLQSFAQTPARSKISTIQGETLEIAALRDREMECQNCHSTQVIEKRHGDSEHSACCQACGASLSNPTLPG
jgi:hypothetical protein